MAEAGYAAAMVESFRILREPPTDAELERAKVSIEGDAVYERETAQGLARKIGFYEAVAGGIGAEARYNEAVKKLEPGAVARVAAKYLHPRNLSVSMLGPEKALPDTKRLAAIAADAFREATAAPPRRKVSARAKEAETRHELPGGATLIVREERAVPLVAIRSVFLGGLRFENDANAGDTHLVARLLCKGTETRSYAEIVRAVDRFAGGVSGFSGFNSFGVRMDALSAHTAEAIELYADILQRPSFEARELEHERTQVLESIRSMKDHPSAWAMRLFARALFTRHPYRLPILGDAERIAVPRNLSLAVVGDVDTAEIVDRVGHALEGYGHGRTFLTPEVAPEPPVDRPRVVSEANDKEQVHMVLGFLGASFRDPHRHALELIATALSGQGGRLFLELRDRQGLAYSVTAFSQEALDPGYFAVYVATDPKKKERALDAIRKELARLAHEGLSAEELARNQRQLVGSFEIDLQRAAARAANLAFNDRYGLGFQDYRNYPDRILAVTREEIVDAARRFLDPERSVLAVVGPDAESLSATAAG